MIFNDYETMHLHYESYSEFQTRLPPSGTPMLNWNIQ